MKLAFLMWLINLPISYVLRMKLLNYAGAKVNNAKIRRLFFLDHPTRLSIGDQSFINYFCHIHCGDYGHVSIGKNVFIGPDVKLCCVSHEVGDNSKRAGKALSGDIVIEDGVWIGIGSIILPGVQIGTGSVVAAGSVVTKTVPSDVLVGGCPAKVIRQL